MSTVSRLLALVEAVVLGSSLFAQTGSSVTSRQPVRRFAGFVTRSGSHLMLDGKPFRFAGANLDNVNLASNRYSLICSISGKIDAYYPSKFVIDNAFETLRKMGGTVARVYSAGTQGSPLAIEPSLGVFNKEALKQFDYVIKSAGDHGVRLDLVLVSQQDFYVGGRQVFSHWRNGASFYNEPVVSEFEEFIHTVLTRLNSYTGVAYKDDPAIWDGRPTTRSAILPSPGKTESVPISKSSIRTIWSSTATICLQLRLAPPTGSPNRTRTSTWHTITRIGSCPGIWRPRC
jgi:mannan endo-1,4-beta-mannosidase